MVSFAFAFERAVISCKKIVADLIRLGVVSSLKSQKKDVDQMRKDTECGIAFQDWEDFKVGDKIQCYEEKSEKRSL
jgi:translation initiation factor IF-2